MANKLFDKVRMNRPKLNKFDLSHERKLSCNMGDLIPVFLSEVLPGDRFRVNSEIMMRMAPMLAPIMHRCDVTTHFFFVPNRLVWDEWESFITGGPAGTDAPVPPIYIGDNNLSARMGKGTLWDYFGLPIGGAPVSNPIGVSALPFRCYQMIYNEYYRDQNVTTPVTVLKSSGIQTDVDDDNFNLLLRKRAWEKDYFTSALPWAQRGGDATVPIESTPTYRPVSLVRDEFGVLDNTAGDLGTDGDADGHLVQRPSNADRMIDNIASISSASITINLLRRAVKLQEWLEKNARGGARYVEQMLSHFGVVSSDARLQRPEYLGGGKNPIVISEVLSTFQDDAGAIPQGNMAGHGIGVGKTHGFTRKFEEHGFIIGIMSVLPRTAYQQGAHRLWSRGDKTEYAWPEFAHLGEQEVRRKEIYHAYDAVSGDDGILFGYQSRYCEYKYMQDSVHGDFRDTLAYWHMGRIFDAAPELNTAFIESDPTHRIFPVTDPTIHKLYVQIYNNVSALRPLPYFGTPSL